MSRKYTKQQLKKVIKNNHSIAGCLKELGLKPCGGNYTTIKKWLSEFEIDTSHFTGKGHLKGKTHDYRTRPINEILVYGKYENTDRLRKRLLKEGLRKIKCEICNLQEWNGKPIPLELHHVDGDRKNNTDENLKIVCPNCHTFTHNYRRRKNVSR